MKKIETIQKSKISIILDSYDDIFSDFDPRHYSEKSFSDDFIKETRKVAIGKRPGDTALYLMIPDKVRNKANEQIIIGRLHGHFKKHYFIIKNEIKGMRIRGMIFLISGLSILGVAAYLSLINVDKNFMLNYIKVTLEPAGWFLCWNGFDHIFFAPNRKHEEHEFYEILYKSHISFISY